MGLIQHPKIGNLRPVWAPFHGFSLLFDNSGDCFRSQPSGLQLLHNQLQKGSVLNLYQCLDQWVRETGTAHLMNTYGFCPLPASSFHVTVWDGIHQGQVKNISSEHRGRVREFLESLPGSFSTRQPFLEGVSEGSLIPNQSWKIRFQFSHLSFRQESGLAAVLEPVDELSRHLLNQLSEGRSSISGELSHNLRFEHDPGEYVPHITLGYFLNQALASRLSPHIEISQWTEQLRSTLNGVTLEFSSVGIYVYTDMASFFRMQKPTPAR